jgi:hypothetical protein
MAQLSNWGKSLTQEDNPMLSDVGLNKNVSKEYYMKKR